MTTQDDHRGWHFNKGIDPSNILLTAIMMAGFFVWAIAQDRRVTTVEIGVRAANDANIQQDIESRRVQDQTRADLRAINDKLDRLLERGK